MPLRSIVATLALALASLAVVTAGASCRASYIEPSASSASCDELVTHCRPFCTSRCDNLGCFPSCYEQCWQECYVDPNKPNPDAATDDADATDAADAITAEGPASDGGTE